MAALLEVADVTVRFGGLTAVDGVSFALEAGEICALIGHLTPPAFDLTELILEFAAIMVGGLGSLVGSVVGAVVITAAPEFFHGLPGYQELLFGILIILVILFLPRGLASLLARLHPVFADRYHRAPR